MDSPDSQPLPSERWQLEQLLDRVLNTVYPPAPSVKQPPLPLTKDDVFDSSWLATMTLKVVAAVEAKVVGVWAGTAMLLGQVAPRAHRENCRRSALPGGAKSFACEREVDLCDALLCYLARLFRYDLDRADAVTRLLEIFQAEPTGGALDLSDAIEPHLMQVMLPHWLHRRVPPASNRHPTIQVASPITRLTHAEYQNVRSIISALRSRLDDENMWVDIPSDFVNDSNKNTVPPDEYSTRGALYHASALVVLTDGGAFGTAQTWTIAEECGIPTLVLHMRNADISAARFPGLKTRMIAAYAGPDEAKSALDRFLLVYATAIEARARRLERFYRDQEADGLRVRLGSIDPLAFSTSTVSYEMALFLLQDSVVWGQARPLLQEEVRRVLGSGAPAQAPASLAHSTSADQVNSSIRHLFEVAEVNDLSASEIASAWAEHQLETQAQNVSHRPLVEKDYDAWVTFLRTRGWHVQ